MVWKSRTRINGMESNGGNFCHTSHKPTNFMNQNMLRFSRKTLDKLKYFDYISPTQISKTYLPPTPAVSACEGVSTVPASKME